MMQRALRPSALVSCGFDVENAVCAGTTTVISVRPTSGTGLCAGCGARSMRIHSRYQRRLTDLPLAGRQVRLMGVARRFRCDTVLCGRRIFTERFDDGALAPWARRTARLDLVVHHLGLAWVAGQRRVLSADLCCPSAMIRCFGSFEGAGVHPLLHRALSASEQSSATSGGDYRSTSYPTGSQLLRRLGSPGNRKLL
jgi:hypothetical protein